MTSNARGYKWPPFENGHTLTVKHGAQSERLVSAKASEVHAALLDVAPWVSDLDAGAVDRYVRAEARARMLSDHIARVGAQDPAKVPPTLWDSSTRADLAAAQLAGTLGLDPTSRAKLLKDLGAVKHYSAIAAEDAAKALRERYGRRAVQNTPENTSGVVDAPSGHSDDSATSLRPMRRVGGGARATSTAQHED